jgi:uncharacterized protein (TIGR03437 family)
VSAVNPTSGTTAGGTPVTVTGTGFTPDSEVTFGGYQANSVTYVSPTQLSAVSPAHAAGAADVRVSTAAGRSDRSSGDRFTYTGS